MQQQQQCHRTRLKGLGMRGETCRWLHLALQAY
jgi:hypothetical protein